VGLQITETEMSSLEACLKACANFPSIDVDGDGYVETCQWANYNPQAGTCELLDSCLELIDSCTGCISSNINCDSSPSKGKTKAINVVVF